MHENAFSFHNLETPAPGAILPVGRHVLRGWIVPKPAEHFVDVRAVACGRVFAGIHGLPRVDLAIFFKTGRSHLLAEFNIVVELAAGPVEIIFEALDISGHWREFDRTRYRVDASGPTVGFGIPGGPFRWHDFCRSLDLILRAKRTQPDSNWLALARKTVAELPYPRDLRTPEMPFVGFTDEPAVANCCTFGQIPVIGHVFHTGARIRKIKATADLQVLQTLEYHRNLPAVGAHYSQYPTAGTSGYLGFVDVPSQLPNPAMIRIYAEMADQSLHLVHVLRTRLHNSDDEKLPYAPSGPRAFDEAVAAWRQALQERSVPVLEDGDFQPGLDRLRMNYVQRIGHADDIAIHPARVVSARTPATAPPHRVLLVTHNLNLEGAPLFLMDYARHLASAGMKIVVLSPSEGPLRLQFEAIGIPVRVVNISGVFAAQSQAMAYDAIRTLSNAHDFVAFDLVVASTFTSFWAVHAAKMAGRPALLYVHESTTPANFYLTRVHLWIISLTGEAFRLADAVSFTTASTRNYHLNHGRTDNHWLTPGWIDVARIDRWLGQNPRAILRDRFGLRSGELLVTNIGTVCERKGQHIFVRAVDLLWQRYPDLAARTRFLMLGGGTTAFDASLADLLSQVNRSNLTVHPATADYFPYYAAADLFVCTSFEESSPRVILEAMAFGVPIVSTDVHGIAEQARTGSEALLVPAGDTHALCEGLARMLLQPERAAVLAANARNRVVAEFNSSKMLPRHLALACELAARRG